MHYHWCNNYNVPIGKWLELIFFKLNNMKYIIHHEEIKQHDMKVKGKSAVFCAMESELKPKL